MTTALQDVLLIGLDGGATEVKAHQVNWSESAEDPLGRFQLGTAAASRKYEPLADFAPVAVAEQFAQRDAGQVELTEGERLQGERLIRAAVESVVEVSEKADKRRVLVGMGMPGLKTEDLRGIVVINNGPRIPSYLDQLEQELAGRGIELIQPVAALGSDADYCGLGEMHADSGLLRDVENAYYAGAGTGIADAMKLHGRLVPFDEAKPWLQKAWQFPSAVGPTFEKLVSAKSLNAVYHQMAPSRTDAYPESDAAAGNATAQAVMQLGAAVLAELLMERLWTIARGRAPLEHRGEAYQSLTVDHPFVGTMVDRLIIGQRLGTVYADPRHRATFAQPLDACLAELIQQSEDAQLIAHCLEGDRLQPGLVQGSTLRAAPAIGAAVAAVDALR